MNANATVLVTRLETSDREPGEMLVTYGEGCPRPGDAQIVRHIPEGTYRITWISKPSIRPILYGDTGAAGKALDLADSLPWWSGVEGETFAMPLASLRCVKYEEVLRG